MLSKDNTTWKSYIKRNRGWARSFLIDYVNEDLDRLKRFTQNMKKIMRKEWLISKEEQFRSNKDDRRGATQVQINAQRRGNREKAGTSQRAARKTISVDPLDPRYIESSPLRQKTSLYTDTPLPSEGYGLRGRVGDEMKNQVRRVRKVAGLQYDEYTTHYIWKQAGVKISYDASAAAQTSLPSADSVSAMPDGGLKEGESADKFNETWCAQCVYHYDKDIADGFPPHLATQCGGAVFWEEEKDDEELPECACCREKGIICEFTDLYDHEKLYRQQMDRGIRTTYEDEEDSPIFTHGVNPFTNRQRTVDKGMMIYWSKG
ncbi:hypothetical protein CALCODRAFT_512212 [Calocera cornea HHB12733]|nr:hypothetical protein CALCODRAFT_512212 [Calocera cornea HHB12733]